LRDHGYVSHREAIIARMNSDLQLFSQPAYFKPHIYSGKIFEMLRVGVPILAITRTDGAVATLLDRTGAGIAQYRHEDVAVILKDFFDKWKRGERLTTPDGAMVSAYSRETLANRLASTLEETLVLP
jgi:glycosyltransferase involved in cell wall biosynthesis